MSTINSGSSSIWQQANMAAAASTDEQQQTWRNAAARLTSDINQLRVMAEMNDHDQYMDNNIINTSYDYNCHKKFGFSDLPFRNLSVKLHHHFDNNSSNSNSNNNNNKQQQCADNKWYKTLPPGEMLPRNEALGGYIFVCNNETMQEDLRRQLFGLPQKYKDSVRAITPGLPLFLYNYTSHQLHGVFQAVSFGGSNIDPTAWEDKKCRGESRFPAQVRIRIKKKCKPLEEDAFRPILYHYDGPKFRLQLSVPEALALLDLFKEEDM